MPNALPLSDTLQVVNRATGEKMRLPVPEAAKPSTQASNFVVVPGSDDPETLTVIDHRTNKLYTLNITNNAINAADFQKIRSSGLQQGLRLYDP
ncbi:hypothetical protein H4R34_005567, partial [Dimargaris verticillata]